MKLKKFWSMGDARWVRPPTPPHPKSATAGGCTYNQNVYIFYFTVVPYTLYVEPLVFDQSFSSQPLFV